MFPRIVLSNVVRTREFVGCEFSPCVTESHDCHVARSAKPVPRRQRNSSTVKANSSNSLDTRDFRKANSEFISVIGIFRSELFRAGRVIDSWTIFGILDTETKVVKVGMQKYRPRLIYRQITIRFS